MGNNENRSHKEVQLLARADKLEYATDIYGPASLMTNPPHINASRMVMVNHQLGHMINIGNPEAPMVPTGFENVLGSYSTMLEKADSEYEIVAKFEKNQYNYVLIGFDKRSCTYTAWKRVELEEHSEGFATRYKNAFLDGLDVGDVIPEGQYVKKPESIDKYGNYCFGKNLNTVYMVSTMVLEDGLLLMNDAHKIMPAIRCYRIVVPMNDNEVFINLYGDDEEYQGFPNIGEKVKNGILCGVRVVDNAKAPYALKSKRLRLPERDDRLYYVEGRVIDVNIRCNKDRSKFIEAGTNDQVNAYYDHQQEYHMGLYKYMDSIVRGSVDDDYTYTDEFSIICEEVHDYVDAGAFFSDGNESVFGNMQLEFVIMDEEEIVPGSKLVGLSGNKGVVSHIIPKEHSWKMEDGREIQAVVAALGIVGRLNPHQLNIHSITDMGNTAIARMKETDNLDKKGEIIHELMVLLNSEEASAFKKYYRKLSLKDKERFCKKVEKTGITIVQDPYDNANIMDIAKAYEKFPPNYQRIVFPDGCKSLRKAICAPMFFMRLKQDPVEKYSARSRGPINPLYQLPAKSTQKKKHLEVFSDVPVRIGALEIEVLETMCNHPQAIADFMAENSTSWEAKRALAGLYTINPEDDIDIGDVAWGKKNYETIASYVKVLGSEFNIKMEEAKEGEYFYD